MNDNMQDILKNYYAAGGKTLFESAEQLDEGIADNLKGAMLGAAITFAAINTDLDKVFVEPIKGAIEQFQATDKPTKDTVAVVDPDTKEITSVKPEALPVNRELVDLEMKNWMRQDSWVLGYYIKDNTLIIKLSDKIYKGYHAYLNNVRSGRMRDQGIKDAYEYAGFRPNDRVDMAWAKRAGIKDVKYSTNVTIPAQSKEPEKEKTPYLTRPGDKGKYKIISTRPWREDPDNVTVILTMRINADGTKLYSVQGIDVKNNLVYVQARGQRNSSEDYTQMKDIFRSSNGINFDSKGVDIDYGTIQAMYRQELIRSDRGVKSSAPKKDSTSVKAYKDAIAKRDNKQDPITNRDEYVSYLTPWKKYFPDYRETDFSFKKKAGYVEITNNTNGLVTYWWTANWPLKLNPDTKFEWTNNEEDAKNNEPLPKEYEMSITPTGIKNFLDKYHNSLDREVSMAIKKYNDTIDRYKVEGDVVKVYFKSPYDKGSNKDKHYVENTLAKVKEKLERKSDIDTVKFYRIKS